MHLKSIYVPVLVTVDALHLAVTAVDAAPMALSDEDSFQRLENVDE